MPTMSKEYMKNYINTKHAENHHCDDCGGHYKLYFKNVHIKSKKHQKAIAQQEKELTEIEKLREDYVKLQNIIKNLIK
jgi:hypothetical protein